MCCRLVFMLWTYAWQVRRPRDTCCPLVFSFCIYTSQVRRPRDTCCPPVTRSRSLTSRTGWWRWSGIPCPQSTYSSPTTTAGSACSTRTVCPRSPTSRCRVLRPLCTLCPGYPALPACLPPVVRQHIFLSSYILDSSGIGNETGTGNNRF